MKKYFTFLSFIALFFIGMQISSAQSTDRQIPEAIAKEKTHQLHQLVSLTGEQQSAIFRVLVDYEQNSSELNKMESTSKLRQEGLQTVDQRKHEAFRKILTTEQYNLYRESLNKDKK